MKKDTYLQIDVLDVIARIRTGISSIKAQSLYTTPYVIFIIPRFFSFHIKNTYLICETLT